MSDLAFENYCIACDKVCESPSAIYCSEACKQHDETQSVSIRQGAGSAATSTFAGSSEVAQDLVSPLLAPAVHASTNYSTSPLFLGQEDTAPFDLDYNAIDLNYTESRSSDLTEHFPSTSHNYRKWLTACL
ncbi:hypothetical protein JA9_004743 [Meyerozyma sp. JA9]|nr:hypothetical protein JA9_004743 [Meyerozyma sp. JA9]